jgi:2-alkenal reductase
MRKLYDFLCKKKNKYSEELEMNKNKSFLISIVALVAILVLSGCSLPSFTSEFVQPVKAESKMVSQIVRQKSGVLESESITKDIILSDLESTLSKIHSDVNPSVVSIQVFVNRVPSDQAPGSPFAPQNPGPQMGSGSGFVWDKDGRIVTNNHVVEGADKISVRFSDGSTASAELIGADPDSDLAVIQVDVSEERLQPVTVTGSNSLIVGQLAVAIGSPFGLENTMTVGFISALGRSLPVEQNTLGSYTIPNIIQTDAPINPGNSGGVLVNSMGEVVGVTTAIISPVRASAGIGFAVPSDIVLKVVPELIENGVYKHAWLGLSGFTINSDFAEAVELPADLEGVMVATVIEGGPAEEYGLQAGDSVITLDGVNYTVGGDIITEFEGEKIRSFEDLVALLSLHRAGEEISLTLLRKGSEIMFSMTLGERPTAASASELQGEFTRETPVTLGIVGITLNEELAAVLELDNDQKGILIGQVIEGSVADRAGLRGSDESITKDEQRYLVGGDIITAWNSEAVESVPDLREKLSEAESGDEVELTIIRDGEFLTLTLEF